MFTSVVDKKTTVQPFKDYIFREEEIALARESRAGKVIPIPNRLRGKVLELVRKLQVLHKKCPYHALVKYYCPVSVSARTALYIMSQLKSCIAVRPRRAEQICGIYGSMPFIN